MTITAYIHCHTRGFKESIWDIPRKQRATADLTWNMVVDGNHRNTTHVALGLTCAEDSFAQW